MEILNRIIEGIWTPWLLGAFLLLGLCFSLRAGFFQLFGIKVWMSEIGHSMFGEESRGEGALTQFQTVATALAATIGTGSIAGVATAIFYGGPGAVFWMWVCAFLGMMIGFVEKTVTICYRRREKGGWVGGPMEYIEDGLRSKPLALWYALAVTAAALGGGGMVQANSIAAGLYDLFGWNRLAVGVGIAAVCALVIFGGISRIGTVCEYLTPVMATVFLFGGGIVLFQNRQALLPALKTIVEEAFAPQSVAGGGLGYGMMAAMRYGVARGVFTNEAGLGSSAMVHAHARVKKPVQQGIWGMFEVFFSTLVVCTVSSLVILTSGICDKEKNLTLVLGGGTDDIAGVPMAMRAFEAVFGVWGGVLVTVCLILFAFSSLLGWSYYGERGLSYLMKGEKGKSFFRLLFLGAVVWGSVGQLGFVWKISDLCNAMMAIPNLIALAFLSPEAFRLWENWMEKPRKC